MLSNSFYLAWATDVIRFLRMNSTLGSNKILPEENKVITETHSESGIIQMFVFFLTCVLHTSAETTTKYSFYYDFRSGSTKLDAVLVWSFSYNER